MPDAPELTPASRRGFLRRAIAFGIGSTLLAACGPSPVSSLPTTAPAQTGAKLSGTVAVSYPDEAGKKPPYVQAAADQVTTANPNAKITVDLQKISSGDYYTKLLLGLQSGSGPDVTHVGGETIGEMVDAGYLAPLDEYVSTWADWKNYPDAVKQSVTYKGKVYGIPYGLDTRFLYYRKDVFQKAGLDPNWQPKNVQDILDTAKQVQAKVPDVIPYALYAGKAGDTGTANHGFVPILWAYGGDLQDKSGKWIGDSPALRKAFTYYQQAFTQAKLVPSEVLTSPKPWTAMREKEGNGGLAVALRRRLGLRRVGRERRGGHQAEHRLHAVPDRDRWPVFYDWRTRHGVDADRPVQEQGPGLGVHQDLEQQGHRCQVEHRRPASGGANRFGRCSRIQGQSIPGRFDEIAGEGQVLAA
jgi:ABC-type glycerol-3-phosphate transport system substrate-binding protein